MRCFVTVGTTQFDELVQAVLSEESCRALKNLGITEVVAQCGRGSYLPPGFQKKDGSSKELNGLNVILYKYKNQIQSDMENSQLIIGHAGAGTCLEALRLSKPFVGVINCNLMDDHQRELADRLSSCGCIVATTPEELHSVLNNFSLNSLKPFLPSDLTKLSHEIDRIVGLSGSA
ncbi:unnamed protein product [Enterobius vermicularis]|uniref:UDP-N-acetylglucosamine transferase subunit ALG13 n=1 Tax=Enterobius vermicularis TaxID=51028 RepID=A0A0N4V7G8_ENTVE|nr:unnamed protein product [Enterobius vermicularis]